MCGNAPPAGGAMCTPETCAQENINCGPAGDGCGGVIADCGVCHGSEVCGGGGVPRPVADAVRVQVKPPSLER